MFCYFLIILFFILSNLLYPAMFLRILTSPDWFSFSMVGVYILKLYISVGIAFLLENVMYVSFFVF